MCASVTGWVCGRTSDVGTHIYIYTRYYEDVPTRIYTRVYAHVNARGRIPRWNHVALFWRPRKIDNADYIRVKLGWHNGGPDNSIQRVHEVGRSGDLVLICVCVCALCVRARAASPLPPLVVTDAEGLRGNYRLFSTLDTVTSTSHYSIHHVMTVRPPRYIVNTKYDTNTHTRVRLRALRPCLWF